MFHICASEKGQGPPKHHPEFAYVLLDKQDIKSKTGEDTKYFYVDIRGLLIIALVEIFLWIPLIFLISLTGLLKIHVMTMGLLLVPIVIVVALYARMRKLFYKDKKDRSEPNVTVLYGGDPYTPKRNVTVKDVSSESFDFGRIVTFTLTWGGFLGLWKKQCTFQSKPIDPRHSDIVIFFAWPKDSDITEACMLRYNAGGSERSRYTKRIPKLPRHPLLGILEVIAFLLGFWLANIGFPVFSSEKPLRKGMMLTGALLYGVSAILTKTAFLGVLDVCFALTICILAVVF